MFYETKLGKMLDRDVAYMYAPVAPNWINFDDYYITVEGCLL